MDESAPGETTTMLSPIVLSRDEFDTETVLSSLACRMDAVGAAID